MRVKFFVFILFIMGGSFNLKAQVESPAFDLLLKTMLNESVPYISVSDLAKKDLSQLELLDARGKKEFEVSHLPHAKWVGFDEFDLAKVRHIDKAKPIVIYCSIGVRSEKIGEKLMAAGYTNVRNLYGSIFEWVNEGHPVYDSEGHVTKKVHAYNKTWGIWLKKGEKVY